MEIQVVGLIFMCCDFDAESTPDSAWDNVAGTFASVNTHTQPCVCPPHLEPRACLSPYHCVRLASHPGSLNSTSMGLLLYLLILFSIIFQKASYYPPCPICFCVSLKRPAVKLIFLAHFIDILGEWEFSPAVLPLVQGCSSCQERALKPSSKLNQK